ncbi:MAG TPA: putative glycoside hydrolase, partial [Acidimicrobiales bacterium]|nr:putative glycoside hydrolase [Acidimicrobiales bacterium]
MLKGRSIRPIRVRRSSSLTPPEQVATPRYPEFDWDLGQPTGPYTHLGSSVYRRDFSAGTVVVNAAASSPVTLDLGGRYLDHDGNPITTLTLGATRGAVLRAAPRSTTTTAPAPPPVTTTTVTAPVTTTTAAPPTTTTTPAGPAS